MKALSSITFLVLTILLSSCSNIKSEEKSVTVLQKKPLVEGIDVIAKRQMKRTINELAKNPSSISISKLKQEHKSDSAYVVSFTMRGQNGFGGYTVSKHEYIYAIQNDGVYEALLDLEERPRVFDTFIDVSNRLDKIGKYPGITECYKKAIDLIIVAVGRKVPSESTKDVDLSYEWGK